MAPLVSVDDYRKLARRRLPKIVFDYLEGGALDEHTLRSNITDLQQVSMRQNILRDVSVTNIERTVLGTRVRNPVLISPMGLLTLFDRDADVAMARAAHDAGSVFVHSAWSGTPLREVANAAPGAVWAQLSMWKDAELVDKHIERARGAGIDVLVVAGDVSVSSKRERDLHNRFGMTTWPTIKDALDAARKPRWLRNFLFGPRISFGDQTNGGEPMNLHEMHEFMEEYENDAVTWADIATLRDKWPGKLVVKGVMTAQDAIHARDAGADGVFVSNHGGRQFDGQPSTVHALEEVGNAVGGNLDILVDSGIRRGADVLKLTALGAGACLVGRPAVYGFVGGGYRGVVDVLKILAEEASTAMAFTGNTRLERLHPGTIQQSAVTLPDSPMPVGA